MITLAEAVAARIRDHRISSVGAIGARYEAALADGNALNVLTGLFCAPNTTILLVYIPAKIKMNLSEKMIFFLPKSASSVSQLQAHFPALFKHIHKRIRSAEG